MDKNNKKSKGGLFSTLNFNYNKDSIKQENSNSNSNNNKKNKNNNKTKKSSFRMMDSSSNFMNNYMIEDIDKCLDIYDSTFGNNNKIKSEPLKNTTKKNFSSNCNNCKDSNNTTNNNNIKFNNNNNNSINKNNNDDEVELLYNRKIKQDNSFMEEINEYNLKTLNNHLFERKFKGN